MIIRTLAFIFLIVIFTSFAINNREFVEIDLFPLAEKLSVRIFIVFLTSFTFGIFFSIILFGANGKCNKTSKDDKNTIKALKNEIEALKLDKQIKKQL